MRINKKHTGVTLLIAILILSTILAISFSLATILLAESRNSGDLIRTEPALYADNGISEEALFNVGRNTGVTSYSSSVGAMAVSSSSTPLNNPVQTVEVLSTNTTYGCGANCYALYNPASPYGPGGYGRIKLTFLNTNTTGVFLNVYLCQWDPANPPKNPDGTYKNVCSDPTDSSYMTYMNTSPLTPGQSWDTNVNCSGCMDTTGTKQQELILDESYTSQPANIYVQISTFDSSGNPVGIPYFDQTAVTVSASNAGVNRDIKVVVPNPSGNRASGASGYLHSRSLTINAGQVPSTQSNFPVLVCFNATLGNGAACPAAPELKSSSNGGVVQSSNGTDILFTSDSGGNTVIPYEQENYVAATGEMEYWVNLPTASAGQVFYMFYDKSGAIDQSNKAGVWSNGYEGVWHLNNTLGTDSSANGYNATVGSGLTTASAQINNGIQITSSSNAPSNYIQLPSAFLTPVSTTAITLSIWLKSTSTTILGQSFGIIQNSGNYVFNLQWNGLQGSGGSSGMGFNDGIWHHTGFSTDITNNGTFNYIVGTYDGSTLKYYVNGNLDASIPYAGTLPTSPNTSTVAIGQTDGTGETTPGIYNEARISQVTRSADWITTEYNNQANPGNFYSIGAEQ